MVEQAIWCLGWKSGTHKCNACPLPMWDTQGFHYVSVKPFSLLYEFTDIYEDYNASFLLICFQLFISSCPTTVSEGIRKKNSFYEPPPHTQFHSYKFNCPSPWLSSLLSSHSVFLLKSNFQTCKIVFYIDLEWTGDSENNLLIWCGENRWVVLLAQRKSGQHCTDLFEVKNWGNLQNWFCYKVEKVISVYDTIRYQIMVPLGRQAI